MWRRQWQQVIPFFAYPPEVRTIIYTTNAIESLHMRLRKIVKNRSHFPSDDAASKLLYLALRNIEKDWKIPQRTWKQAANQFAIMFGERFTNAIHYLRNLGPAHRISDRSRESLFIHHFWGHHRLKRNSPTYTVTNMTISAPDIYQFALLHHESLEFPDSHARSLQLFKNSVVHPSLQTLSSAIEANNRDEDPAAVFLEDDLANLFQATVESYLLAVQSMWERGLRDLLVTREKRLKTGIKIADLQRANWSGKVDSLQIRFKLLIGVPLTAFDSYADLDFLQHLGNAIRHGDGSSAEKIHTLAPSLWFNWLGPGEVLHAGPYTIVVPKDAPKHPSFNKVTLEQRLLEQMIQSVTNFWQDLEYIRCNSFRSKSDSTIRHMEKWVAERGTRQTARFWNQS